MINFTITINIINNINSICINIIFNEYLSLKNLHKKTKNISQLNKCYQHHNIINIDKEVADQKISNS